MNKIDSIIEYMPNELANVLNSIDRQYLNVISEIRIRRDKPIIIIIRNSSYFVNSKGVLLDYCTVDSFVISSIAFDNLFIRLCDYSIHSNIQNLKRGFLTLNNGSRVGIASTAVVSDNGNTFVKNVVALNIRVPQEIKGCSKGLLNTIYKQEIPSIIVAGRPNSGKTTLLRDIAYQLSSGYKNQYHKIAIIDERNEFAAKHENNLSMDLGVNTDVLTYFSKSIGIEIATRALSPELIICDEVATNDELSSIMYAFSSGVSFALSVHISDKDDLITKPIIKRLLNTKQIKYIVLLDNYTYIPKIIDAKEVLSEIYRNDISNNLYNPNGV